MGGLSHTVSGDIASFRTPSRVPIESLKFHFLPKQEGSGDPSPTNKRTITGWTGLNGRRARKNIGDVMWSANGGDADAVRKLSNNYGTSINTLDYIYPNGPIIVTQTKWDNPSLVRSYMNGYVAPVIPNLKRDGYYDVSFKVTNIISNPLNASLSDMALSDPYGNGYVNPAVIDNVVIFKNYRHRCKDTAPNRKHFEIRICGMNCTISELMVTPANTSDGVFEPYSGEQIPITFPDGQTIYGGYVDPVAGEIVAEYEILEGSWGDWPNLSDQGDGTELRYMKFSNPVYGNGITNHNTDYCNVAKYNYNNANGTPHYYIVGSSYNCRVYLPSGYDTTQNVQVIGKLITPIHIPISAENMKAFLDYNNFWSDANGITEVTYAVTESKDILATRKMAAAFNIGDYVKDGLILWMDGIDKGNVSGAWVDKIAGHVFSNINGMTVGSNYIALSRSNGQMLENDTFDGVNYRDGTIEVVISDYDPYAAIAFAPSVQRGLCFGFGTSGSVIYGISVVNDGDYMNHVMVTNPNRSGKIFSINYENAIVDGEIPEYTENVSYFGQDYPAYNHIGGRVYTYSSGTSPNYFDGKIHAIRVYNRKLSLAEMRHNQRIDNRRFNLGLSL